MSAAQLAMSQHPKFRNTLRFPQWPHGVIPYKLTSWKHKIISWNIKSALNSLSEKTGGCVRFRKATSQDKDYIKVIYGDDCSSFVGRVGGAQTLSLGFGCEIRPAIQHQFMHALGFFHEHQRSDRDEHIIVKWKNVRSDKCGSFRKAGTVPPLPYDINSLMHYGSFTYSCELGKSTIFDRNQQKIGGKLGGVLYPNSLSDYDVAKIKHMYGCL